MSTIKCIKSPCISFWTHACLAHNICIIPAKYSVSRIMTLAHPSSILDLRHQNRSDHYQHHVKYNNHISITVSFTTISKHRRKLPNHYISLSFNKMPSSVCSCTNMIQNIDSNHSPCIFQLKQSLVISWNGKGMLSCILIVDYCCFLKNMSYEYRKRTNNYNDEF